MVQTFTFWPHFEFQNNGIFQILLKQNGAEITVIKITGICGAPSTQNSSSSLQTSVKRCRKNA